jgi:hypothetical protein
MGSKPLVKYVVVALVLIGAVFGSTQISFAKQSVDELVHEMQSQMWVAYSGTALAYVVHTMVKTGKWNYFETWLQWCSNSPEMIELRKTNSIVMPTFRAC